MFFWILALILSGVLMLGACMRLGLSIVFGPRDINQLIQGVMALAVAMGMMSVALRRIRMARMLRRRQTPTLQRPT